MRVLLGDLDLIYQGELDVSHDEIAFFASRIWQILTSCRERRMDEYERLGWWEFIGAAERSPGYQALLGHGITRSLVAAKADLASTKTIGDIFVQLLFDIVEPGPSSDRVLNGPTNDVWISPWLEYLLARGVRYHLDARVTAITCAQGRIQDVTVRSGGAARKVASDYYVCALPIEDLVPLLTPSLVAADPSLANLRQLEQATAWMVGIQIFLTEDVDLAHGHTIYVDSPWALTSISQAQFWSGIDLSQYGNGSVKGIISVDISEWEQKGLNGKTAKECNLQELIREVWDQLKRSLNRGGAEVLKDEYFYHWFMDPDVQLREGAADTNEEPLLVNLVNTWALRPRQSLGSRTCFSPRTTFAPIPISPLWRRPTKRPVAPSTASSKPPVLLPRLAICGSCTNRKSSRPGERWTSRVTSQGLPWDDTLVKLGLAA